MSLIGALRGLKETKEEKLLNKAIRKDNPAPQDDILKLVELINDTMSRQILLHHIKNLLMHTSSEKKFIRLLCVLYRIMDADTESYILQYLATSQHLITSQIPKNSSKTLTTFAKHIEYKSTLFNTYNILIDSSDDVPDISTEQQVDYAFAILELLLDISKNAEEAEWSVAGISFHVSDILLHELTVTFYKVNCYSSALANVLLTMTATQLNRFADNAVVIDRVRHKYFSVLSMQDIKDQFPQIPRLAFMPTGPLQKFLKRRATQAAHGVYDESLATEIEKFNMTFQADIVSNDTKIRSFINRPLVTVEDEECSSRSVSRSISRTKSSNCGDDDKLSFAKEIRSPKTSEKKTVIGVRVVNQKEQGGWVLEKPVARRVDGVQPFLRRTSSANVFDENAFDDEVSPLLI
ncbi:Uncharacterized protein QTN25_010822 [Entamoeba marina]